VVVKGVLLAPKAAGSFAKGAALKDWTEGKISGFWSANALEA
jgi:hypothetical protein